jgi:hypothetical protein
MKRNIATHLTDRPALGLGVGLLSLALLSVTALGALAASVGVNWVGAGTAISDSGGAFGVPLAGWNNLSGGSGTTVISPPSGGALTVTWSTGGGMWQGTPPYPGFSVGENQVLFGNLYAGQNDAAGDRAINVSISGMDSVAIGSYTLRLMAAIDGPSANGAFRPASVFTTGDTLGFDPPVYAGTGMASTTTNLTLSGDYVGFSIANDNVVEGSIRVRAELSGLVLMFTPAPAPVVTNQPQSQTAPEGGTVIFTVGAAGSAPLTYQWQFNDGDLTGETTASLQLTGVSVANAGVYRVKVTDSGGRFSYSSPAALTVAPASPALIYDWSTVTSFANTGVWPAGIGLFFDVAPGTSIAIQQLGAANPLQTLTTPMTVQLFEVNSGTVLATVAFATNETSAAAGILYQWLKPVSGLVLGSGSYAVVQYGGAYAGTPVDYTINSLGGAITHTTSKWTTGPGGPGTLPTNNDGTNPKYAGPTFEAQVSGAPGITRQPQGGSFVPGATATLSVTAGGSMPLTYQWQKNGNNLSGATTPSLILGPLGSTDTADYRVIVGNRFGSVTSAVARIEVAGTPTVAIQMNPGIVVHGTVGLHYRVEWRNALDPGSPWQLLQDIPSLPSATYVVIDPTPISATNQRFYQAVLVP